jgi:hypothetical protein
LYATTKIESAKPASGDSPVVTLKTQPQCRSASWGVVKEKQGRKGHPATVTIKAISWVFLIGGGIVAATTPAWSDTPSTHMAIGIGPAALGGLLLLVLPSEKRHSYSGPNLREVLVREDHKWESGLHACQGPPVSADERIRSLKVTGEFRSDRKTMPIPLEVLAGDVIRVPDEEWRVFGTWLRECGDVQGLYRGKRGATISVDVSATESPYVHSDKPPASKNVAERRASQPQWQAYKTEIHVAVPEKTIPVHALPQHSLTNEIRECVNAGIAKCLGGEPAFCEQALRNAKSDEESWQYQFAQAVAHCTSKKTSECDRAAGLARTDEDRKTYRRVAGSQRCGAGDPEGCDLAAELTEEKAGALEYQDKAWTLRYEDAWGKCHKQTVESCDESRQLARKARREIQAQRFADNAQACSEGNASACDQAALFAPSKKAAKEQERRAHDLRFSAALRQCNDFDAAGCDNAANLADKAKDQTEYRRRALVIREDLCEGNPEVGRIGDPKVCAFLADSTALPGDRARYEVQGKRAQELIDQRRAEIALQLLEEQRRQDELRRLERERQEAERQARELERQREREERDLQQREKELAKKREKQEREERDQQARRDYERDRRQEREESSRRVNQTLTTELMGMGDRMAGEINKGNRFVKDLEDQANRREQERKEQQRQNDERRREDQRRQDDQKRRDDQLRQEQQRNRESEQRQKALDDQRRQAEQKARELEEQRRRIEQQAREAESRRQTEEKARQDRLVAERAAQQRKAASDQLSATSDDQGCWDGMTPGRSPCLQVNRDSSRPGVLKLHNSCDRRLVVEWCIQKEDRSWDCEQNGLRGHSSITASTFCKSPTGQYWAGAIGAEKPNDDWNCIGKARKQGRGNFGSKPR